MNRIPFPPIPFSARLSMDYKSVILPKGSCHWRCVYLIRNKWQKPENKFERSMKRIFQSLRNRIAAIALGGAVVLAGSALAFTQKPKAEKVNLPPVDERPIARDANGHSSFAPVVKKVAPGVVKVFTTTR